MTFLARLLVLGVVLEMIGIFLLIKGIKSKSLKAIVIATILMLMPVAMYFALLYFITSM